MSILSELEPQPVWSHFEKILQIPRASGKEQRIREHIVSLARQAGLEHRTDATGNLVVRMPGTPGHEQAPIVVMQSHLDMVQEKNSDVRFDFDRDAIRAQRDGAYVKASGTTLGSDNGIGVASMLALMEAKGVVHGPLELLFTVDEETGLAGAKGLGSDLLRGRLLINVDSEEEGVLTIGCAGGADTRLYLTVGRATTPPGSTSLTVGVSGLKGGHSGIDIHLQRGNAVRIVARALHAALLDHPFDIASFRGGNAHNAIPREAHATIVTTADATAIAARVSRELQDIARELAPAEPALQFAVTPGERIPKAWGAEATSRALRLLVALPHGVLAMSYDIPGLVETSTNEAVVIEEDGRLAVLMSSRSSIASSLAAVRARIRAIGELAGAEVEEHAGYPGWKPDTQSRMLGAVSQAYLEIHGEPPRVGAVHAGLECGIIGEKFPGMDMISFGPQIEFPHSPDERVKVDSVAPFWTLLTRTLERLA